MTAIQSKHPITIVTSTVMEFQNFLETLSVFERTCELDFRIFVHNFGDTEFFDYTDVPFKWQARIDELYRNVLLVHVEEGWILFDNIRSYDNSGEVHSYSQLGIKLPPISELKPILNHYFSGRTALRHKYLSERSMYDHEGRLTMLLYLYTTIFTSREVKRDVVTKESEVAELAKSFIDSVAAKQLRDKVPGWAYKDAALDDMSDYETFILLTDVDLKKQ